MSFFTTVAIRLEDVCIYLFTVKVKVGTSSRERAMGAQFLLLLSVSKEFFKLYMFSENPSHSCVLLTVATFLFGGLFLKLHLKLPWDMMLRGDSPR